jgi:hypothetical protein
MEVVAVVALATTMLAVQVAPMLALGAGVQHLYLAHLTVLTVVYQALPHSALVVAELMVLPLVGMEWAAPLSLHQMVIH